MTIDKDRLAAAICWTHRSDRSRQRMNEPCDQAEDLARRLTEIPDQFKEAYDNEPWGGRLFRPQFENERYWG
jgi:hypothetical protein